MAHIPTSSEDLIRISKGQPFSQQDFILRRRDLISKGLSEADADAHLYKVQRAILNRKAAAEGAPRRFTTDDLTKNNPTPESKKEFSFQDLADRLVDAPLTYGAGAGLGGYLGYKLMDDSPVLGTALGAGGGLLAAHLADTMMRSQAPGVAAAADPAKPAKPAVPGATAGSKLDGLLDLIKGKAKAGLNG